MNTAHSGPFWSRVLRILRLGWPYRGRLAISVVLSAMSISIALILPLGLRELLDAAVNRESQTALNRLAVVLLGLYAIRALLNFVGPLVLRLTGERITIDLRTKVYRHLHSLGIGYFNGQKTGDLLSRLTSDVGAIRSVITDIAVSLLLQALKLTGSIAIMLVLNWRLSLLIFLVLPLATGLSRHFGPRVQRLSRDLQDKQAAATATAQEALAGIRLVKAYDRADYEVTRFRGMMESVYAKVREVSVTTTGFHSGVELIFMTAIVGIFWFGGTEVLSGRLTAGDFVAFMFYAQNISQGISELIRLYTSAHQSVGASSRVFDLLDVTPETDRASGLVPLSRYAGEIQFERVCFSYGDSPKVLRNVTFSIKPGEHVAIVGISGAGKTTLLSLLLRFYDPTSGIVKIDGIDVRDMAISSVRAAISIVSQETYLFSGTIRSNIAYGRLDASEEAIQNAAKIAQIHPFIASLPDKYDTIVGENGIRLSGGQRQRISIARAVLKDAPILLLDEATSSVDVGAELAIHEATEMMFRNRTTILITHRLESLRRVPRIIVLDEGGVAADGPPQLLKRTNNVYARLLREMHEDRSALSLEHTSEAAPII